MLFLKKLSNSSGVDSANKFDSFGSKIGHILKLNISSKLFMYLLHPIISNIGCPSRKIKSKNPNVPKSSSLSNKKYSKNKACKRKIYGHLN